MSETTPQEWFLEFHDPDNPEYCVVVEDDGFVAYAYFLVNEKISGLVWLYNSANAPARTWEQTKEEGLPPVMKVENIKEPNFAPIADEADVEVMWMTYEGRRDVAIYIRNYVHAALGPGDYPGRCRLVIEDTDLARYWPMKP